MPKVWQRWIAVVANLPLLLIKTQAVERPNDGQDIALCGRLDQTLPWLFLIRGFYLNASSKLTVKSGDN